MGIFYASLREIYALFFVQTLFDFMRAFAMNMIGTKLKLLRLEFLKNILRTLDCSKKYWFQLCPKVWVNSA